MTVRFMLLMPWGRVGSNLMYTVIHQTRVCKLANESLNSLRSAEEQQRWFDDFHEIGVAVPSKTHIGSKQNLRAIHDLPGMLDRLASCGAKIVRMRRDNLVKCALSQMRAVAYAELTKKEFGEARWALPKGEETLGATAIDPAVLKRRIEIMEAAHHALMALSYPGEILDIEYEEINSDLDGVIRRLRDFLRLPDGAYRTHYGKFTPDDVSASIVNYAEVKDMLAGTRFAGML